MKTRTATVLKWIGIFIIVLGIAYGALLIAASRALQREVDSLRADGRPMVADQVIPKNVPPCLLYTSPSPRDRQKSRMPSSA